MTAVTRQTRWVAGTVAVAIGFLLLNPSAAFGATFTWSGQHPTDGSWSQGANWVGGTAPSGSVDVLEFPELPGPECQAFEDYPYEAACYKTTNDVAGLNVGELRLAKDLYELKGNGITLGSGGFTLVDPGHPPDHPPAPPEVELPIQLAIDQTWHLEAGSVVVTGGITGSDADLTIELGGLRLGGVNEVGQVGLRGGVFTLGGDSATLNASSGNSVRAEDIQLRGTGTLGALTATNTLIRAQQPPVSYGMPLASLPHTLAVSGDLMLDPNTEFPFVVDDHVERHPTLTANGHVDLAGAATSFLFNGGALYGFYGCGPDPPVGHVFTLVSATGTVTGEFAGFPDGAVIHPTQAVSYMDSPEETFYCAQHVLQLDYTTHTVDATVIDRTPPSWSSTGLGWPPVNPQGLTFAQATTGERAAALQRCKEKRTKRARRKCRARARRLPI